MSAADILILAVIAVCVFLGIRSMRKKGGCSCGTCSSCASGCTGCAGCEKSKKK